MGDCLVGRAFVSLCHAPSLTSGRNSVFFRLHLNRKFNQLFRLTAASCKTENDKSSPCPSVTQISNSLPIMNKDKTKV